MRRFLIPVLVFIAVFVVSCDEDKKTNNGGNGSEAKPLEEVSQEIPAEEGGKIEAETKDEAVSIEIPAGALDEDVKITMKIYDAEGYKGTEGLDVISKVVEFEPSGTVFKKPVIITMKALKDVGSSAKAAKKKVITAAVYREEKGAWSYSPIGAAVKISGRSEGGDPIMTSAAGDPIMLNAGGDPIMMPSAGGDPIMLSAAGDPIMVTAAGDPIMNSAAGDPIMMTTGHFTSFTFLFVNLDDEETPDGGSAETEDSDNSDTTDDEIIDGGENDGDTAEHDDEPADDSDTDTHESSGDDPCDPNPCGSIENSNGVCHVIFLGRDGDIMSFACDCIDSYGWDGLGCSPVDMSDPCESDPCADIAHSDGECYVVYNTDHVKTFSCGCDDPYSWNGSKCSSSCADDPCSTVYHSNGICYPKPDGKYECGCAENYYWYGSAKKCSNPCTADPCGSVPHTTGCVPKTGTEYLCTCEEVYAWDGTKCVSPCDSNPCTAFEHTTGECTAQAPDFYSCKCGEGLYWWGTVKGCTAEQPTLGRICTSQLRCFNEGMEIPCPAPGEPFYGQDANKAREGLCAPKSFTIVETGIENEDIVRDDNTGLEWMRMPDASGNYRWSDARSFCNNLSYGGYDDWRLPTPREYLTIVNNNKSPTLDMNYFDIPIHDGSGYYNYISWTSSSALSGNYWGIDFSTGALSDYGNNPTNFVRCVRGDTMPGSTFTIPEEYADTEEKIVVDTVTGLQWQYHDADMAGSPFWPGALDYCENLTYAGFDDWRLPNKDELATIIDFGRRDPSSSFPDLENVHYLLTSTTMPGEADAVFRLYLYGGSMNTTMYKNSTSDYHVHCVR